MAMLVGRLKWNWSGDWWILEGRFGEETLIIFSRQGLAFFER
jgi:hypothetical protein